MVVQLLAHARIAFESGAAPLKEIAFRVGYNHVTNFINAFTARYGAPPRRYLGHASTATQMPALTGDFRGPSHRKARRSDAGCRSPGRSTIYEHIRSGERSGELVSIKRGRRRLIDMRSVLQLMDKNWPPQQPKGGKGPPREPEGGKCPPEPPEGREPHPEEASGRPRRR